MRHTTSRVPPLAYFLLTFVLSWAIWIPLTLSHYAVWPLAIPEGVSAIVRLLGVLMPGVAALLLTARAGGGSAVKRLLARFAIWRVGWRWWAAAILVQPALLGLTALVYNTFWAEAPLRPIPFAGWGAWIANLVFLTLAGVGEETGWRGVALPGLQARRSAVVSSLILGLVWATWHLPFWILLGTTEQYGPGYFALNYLGFVPLTFYVTWFFNHSRASLLLPVVFHVVFNMVNVAWLPVTSSVQAYLLLIVAEWVVALLLVRRLEPPFPDSGRGVTA